MDAICPVSDIDHVITNNNIDNKEDSLFESYGWIMGKRVKNNSIGQKYVVRIYTLLFVMLLTDPLLSGVVGNTTILRLIELSCFIWILITELILYKNNCLRTFSSYEKLLYTLLALNVIGIIVRGEWPSSPKDFALHILTTPRFLLPFIVVPLPNQKYFTDLIKLFYKVSLFVIPLWVINVTDLVQEGFHGESIGSYLPFISAFLLGLGVFFNKQQRTLNIVLWAVYFLLMMLNARRNVSLSLLVYAFIAYIFYIQDSIRKNKARFGIIIVASVSALLMLFTNVDSLSSGVFKRMAERSKEDTRSGVEELFLIDFTNSPVSDWIYGRGMDGGYYQIGKNEETGETTDNRTVIETGYLNMVLKGGITYTVVIILIMLLSIKRGYAQHNRTNLFIATILCTYFVDLYTTNPVCIFSIRSILFWFCISLISDKSICKYTKK